MTPRLHRRITRHTHLAETIAAALADILFQQPNVIQTAELAVDSAENDEDKLAAKKALSHLHHRIQNTYTKELARLTKEQYKGSKAGKELTKALQQQQRLLTLSSYECWLASLNVPISDVVMLSIQCLPASYLQKSE